jgi:nitrogen-specific signal transduction histidine kinase
MNTVLLVTGDDALRARLLRHLTEYSVFEAAGDSDAFKTLRLVDIDIVVRDGAPPAGPLEPFLAHLRESVPVALAVAIGSTDDEAEMADFALPRDFGDRDLTTVLRLATSQQRLGREVARLRSGSAAPAVLPPAGAGDPWDGAALARVLKGFTRALAAGFDLPRVLEMSLDAIADLVRSARTAILLPDPSGLEFRIAAHRGLAPQIVESVRLPAGDGLPRWLAAQGRPVSLTDVADPEVTREVRVLQGVMAMPLLAHGELVAILVLGQPVFGAHYGRRETETLFDLATHLATAIRDITLHQQLTREKEFSERILSHMASGVVTIGRDQKVTIINRRAEEILELPARDVLHHDLRVLPSPLGDMLYETLMTGRVAPRSEVQLALRRLWLEVSTYPIRDGDATPIGAALVFEDLTAPKELAAQKREAEQLQLLTRVVARIADEIKNPLVSINTFVELIGERYDDPDFRRHFSSVVRRDVRRLVQVLEKLAGLVTEGELDFTLVDANAVVDQLAESIMAEEGGGQAVQLAVARHDAPIMVKADAAQLRKALSYLILYLTHNSAAERPQISITVDRPEDTDNGGVGRIMVASRTANVRPERLQRLFDPVQMVQESLIDVGPAVSQRLVEALGGRLRFKQSRHELAFVVSLPVAHA